MIESKNHVFGVIANISMLPPADIKTVNGLEIAGSAYATGDETCDEGLKRYLADVVLGKDLPKIILGGKGERNGS